MRSSIVLPILFGLLGCQGFAPDAERSPETQPPLGVVDVLNDTPVLGAVEPAPLLVGASMLELRWAPSAEELYADGLEAFEGSALAWTNSARAAVGLSPLRHDSSLASAASSHAGFVSLNSFLYTASSSISPHKQDPAGSGYVARNFWERAEIAGYRGAPLGEVIAYSPLPAVAVQQWLQSVYHRLPLLDPRATQLGFGVAMEGDRAVAVAVLGADSPPAAPVGELAGPLVYPPSQAQGVPISWDGAESPTPPAPPGGFPSGPVLSVTWPEDRVKGADLLVTGHALLEAGTHPVEHTILDPSNDPQLGGAPAVFLYAHAPLKPRTWYRLQVKGFVNGQTFTVQSWFETGQGGDCNPALGMETCAGGQGCYLDGATPVCAWPGAAVVGDACVHSNDCAPGSTCASGQCRALCAEKAGDGTACALRCPDGSEALAGQDSLRVCRLPQCTPRKASCDGGKVCAVDAGLRCAMSLGVSLGGTCVQGADCGAGLGCVDLGQGFGTCQPLCDASPFSISSATLPLLGSALPSCAESCPEGALAHPGYPAVGICVPQELGWAQAITQGP
jgi:uncharacterized protein YkwD